MLCPECNHQLSAISLRSQTYTVGNTPQLKAPNEVVLDFCPKCGGVWSDQGEINFIQTRNIEPLQKQLPTEPAPTNADYRFLLCPKDKQPLRFFKRESVPQHLTLLRCQQCSGIWFPQNTLMEFKNAQEVKIEYFKTWKIPLHSIYAILLPLLIVALISGGIITTLYGVGQKTNLETRAKNIISQPLVVSPQPGQILISFTTTQPVTSKITYWQNPNAKKEVTVSITPKTNHSVLISQLDEGRSVSYQIETVGVETLTTPVYLYIPKK